ncbi:MAG: hypothetical protein P8Y78_12995 [Acidihalobacter sp.]
MTAAIYAKRQGLDVVVFGDTPGGNLVMIENICNYPGFVGGVSGAQLGTNGTLKAIEDGHRRQGDERRSVNPTR